MQGEAKQNRPCAEPSLQDINQAWGTGVAQGSALGSCGPSCLGVYRQREGRISPELSWRWEMEQWCVRGGRGRECKEGKSRGASGRGWESPRARDGVVFTT